jgi:hypothetical protein
MKFASFIMNDYRIRGVEAFEVNVGFDEYDIVATTRDAIIREFELDDLRIMRNNEVHEADPTKIREAAVPGKPQFYFYNTSSN